jgi:HEAT repeat protein/WD40 repeat protein
MMHCKILIGAVASALLGVAAQVIWVFPNSLGVETASGHLATNTSHSRQPRKSGTKVAATPQPAKPDSARKQPRKGGLEKGPPAHFVQLVSKGRRPRKGKPDDDEDDYPNVIGAVFSPNNKFVFLKYSGPHGKGGKHFELWDVTRCRRMAFKVPDIHRVAFLPDGKRVVSAYKQSFALWDVTNGKVIRAFQNPKVYDWTTTITISADGKRALSGHGSGYLNLWDLRQGKLIRGFRRTDRGFGGIRSVWFLPGGNRALATQQRSVKLWDVTTGKLIRTFNPGKGIKLLALSPDGKRALSGRFLGRVGAPAPLSVWDVANGKEVLRLEGEIGFFRTAVFLPDGKRLLSATENGSVKIWDLTTRKAIRSWEGWIFFVYQGGRTGRVISFSPDGKLGIATAGGTATLWNAVEGKLLRILVGRKWWGEGKIVLPELARLLRNKDPRLRRDAVEDLEKLGPAAVPDLLRALRDKDSSVRRVAARGFGRVHPEARSAIGPLLKTLKDPDMRVRIEAARSLYLIEERQAGRALRVLEEALGHRDSQVRLAATKALGEVYFGAAPLLCRALKDESPAVRRQAAKLLVSRARERGVAPALTAALNDRDNQVRVSAADGLFRTRLLPKGLVRALAGALKDRDVQVRRYAARLLFFIGGARWLEKTDRPTKLAVRELHEALKDKDNLVRVSAAGALLHIDWSDETVIPPLIAALKDKDNEVRKRAAGTLAWIGPRAKAAIRNLIATLQGPGDSSVVAATALAKIGPASVPELVKILKKNGHHLLAISALFEMGPKAEGAAPILIEVLKDRSNPYRAFVAETLAHLGPKAKGAVSVLIAILKDGKEAPNLRVMCAGTLGQIGPAAKEAVPALIEALKDPAVKHIVPVVLKRIDPKAAAKARKE